ncbi:hypothetical protein predicted by Glimmer/Critica [Bdellovibrio bacteriovorus HD100]|uniref:Uncharacterized protein n=1 Tax=Bdellovibrio bacteriovorus (strain ATCC 15356 / DSM 50701 / NCIMB 9529 / HD100) TaxID=264462 RepID=Q6MNG3_BDEBA|nr:hypothetical protein predicted by Glimmer/Critica [Bdellovibrio bacteriovorus HD100]
MEFSSQLLLGLGFLIGLAVFVHYIFRLTPCYPKAMEKRYLCIHYSLVTLFIGYILILGIFGKIFGVSF